MSPDKEMVSKNIIENGGEILEIDHDEYKITLPLNYDFDFSPADEKGKNLPVSSIETRDTRTIINVPGDAPWWKLKVIKREDRSGTDNQGDPAPPGSNEPEDRSHMDNTGESAPPGSNEPEDRFVDWLNRKAKDMDHNTKKKIQTAKREIIIRKEIVR